MKLLLSSPSSNTINKAIQITGSKSETNRLLLLQALFPSLSIENLSNSDDAVVMQKGLGIKKGTVDIHHAGTAMRFLTSFFALSPDREVVLTGSARMKDRPIKVLVDALLQLGASISYEEKEGYPPLRIKGQPITKSYVELPANISSQYISSLCLMAPQLPNGLTIKLIGKITSVPYIKMTLSLLQEVGVATSFEGNTIQIASKNEVTPKTLVVESDWSAASYFYSIVSLADIGTSITLSSYKKDSLQGDRVLAEIYEEFGVTTVFKEHTIQLTKTLPSYSHELVLNLENAPDIAQTIAVSCLGLGRPCYLTGLHTLPIKETDRLAAMKVELEKFGGVVTIDAESLRLEAAKELKGGATVATYNDHRMAMAFAPLALKIDFAMEEAEVVSKSYPDFWKDMKEIGIALSEA